MDFKDIIQLVDFKGVSFLDIASLLKNPCAFKAAIRKLSHPWGCNGVEIAAGPEARGFVVSVPVAYTLNSGLALARKPGKLPGETIRECYGLEYGTDCLEMQVGSIKPGQKVLLVDDVLATGGTMEAMIKLVRTLGGEIIGATFLIEIPHLGGRDRLGSFPVFSLVQYSQEELKISESSHIV